MTDRYVRSAGGNSSPFTTWANAATTMSGADGVDAAGDRIFVRNDHAEDTASPTWSFAGTLANPTQVIGVSDSNEPATTVASGATFDSTTTTTLTVNGSVYMRNVQLRAGAAGNNATLLLGNTSGSNNIRQRYVNCTLGLRGSGTSGRVEIGNSASTSSKLVEWLSCTLSLANASQALRPRGCSFIMRDCTIGGTAPSAMFTVIGDPGQGKEANILLEGCDLSGGGSSMNIATTISGGSRLLMRGCKLPASWSGALVSGTLETGAIARMVNCIISGGNKIRIRDQQTGGTLSDETTFIRSGGFQDEGTGISWKVVTTANVAWPVAAYVTPDIFYRNASTGSPITLKLEALIDSATPLTDKEIWVEAEYMGTASSPLLTTISDKCAILTAAANQTSSSETWTTTGMSNVSKCELAVTITPQVAGDIVLRVYVARASATLYICPKAHV